MLTHRNGLFFDCDVILIQGCNNAVSAYWQRLPGNQISFCICRIFGSTVLLQAEGAAPATHV